MPSEPVLSVRGLRVRIEAEGGSFLAVDGIGYDLQAGRTLALVGESGSGKSVHALALLGLLPPAARVTDGEALYKGRDLLRMPGDDLRAVRGSKIAIVFQEPMTSLNPVMTIGEQIAEPLMTHQGLSRPDALARAATLLGKVGIPDPASRLGDHPHEFSGGMRQRAMIAMALACGPDVLIADEPTTALDVTIQAQILDLLRGLQKELRMALVLITHNLGVVAEMADDVAVMYAGRTVESGPAAEVFRAPRHPYTRALLESVPSLYGARERLHAIGGLPPDPRALPPGCPFAPRCPQVLARCAQDDPPDFLEGGRLSNCWLSEGQAAERRPRGRAGAGA
ncbi:MAG TPA: ABC transporter ATP-binding protein [Elusimicrobiota bacterium]|jgi:oligopeptide transport system ATP-binding protein|nr:ABC transporter ATP-binding protein [Elusimicrobiota bacterium]